MRTIAAVCASGRFVTPATFVVIVLLSVVVLAPMPAAMSGVERTTVAVLTAAAFSGIWSVVAVAERRIRCPQARLILVLTVLVTASVLRPDLQDAVSLALGQPIPPAGGESLRALTNLVAWALALIGTAVLADAAHRTRETDALLRTVLAQLDASAARARIFADDARAAVSAAARTLRSPVPANPGAVRARALAVRDDARALSARADGIVLDDPPPVTTGRTRAGLRLRLPRWGAPTALYVLSVLPYALRTLDAGAVLGGILLTLGAGLIAETAPRLVEGARARNAVFASSVVLAGVFFAAVAAAQQVPWPAAAVPAVAFPALALALAGWRGAAHSLAVERGRLSEAISRRARTDDLGTRAARAGLRAAADLLHREAQGTLVHFAMRHPAPSSTDAEHLSSALDALGDDVVRAFDAPASVPGALAIDELLRTWAHALPIQARLAAEARAALDADAALAADALEVVAEGVLNVAKHAARREAVVTADVVASETGPALRIAVRSPGTLARGAVLRSDAPAARRGARLVADAASTLLTADLPLATEDSVVSTEHSPGTVHGPA